MSKYLNGPDELERLEFISRQQLLKEDKIMRDKINNYVQLVNALTGQEVMLPADTDEYSFVSVDDDDSEEYEEEEYVDDDDDDWDYESIEDDNDDDNNNNNGISGPPPPPPPVAAASASQEAAIGDDANVQEEGKIENMDFVEQQQQQQQVDAIPPPTPSQIIRKLKATLVYAGMEQIKLRRRRSVRRLGNNNWSFDVAKRKLNREMRRIEKRKAYRDAIESLVPGGVGMITAEEEEKEDVSSPPQPVSDGNKSILMDESDKNGQSGSIFMGLLKTLETTKRRLPAAEPTSTTTSRRSGMNNASANPSQMMSRSDQRLQAILQKHHHNLMDQKEKIRSPSPSNPRSKNSDTTRVPPIPPGPPLTQEASGNSER